MSLDNDPQPRWVLDDPWFADALLGEIRDLTRILYPEARIPETAMPTISRDEWMGLIQDFLEARMKDAPDESCKTFAENLWQETAEVDLPETDWDDIKRAKADADRQIYGGMFTPQRED